MKKIDKAFHLVKKELIVALALAASLVSLFSLMVVLLPKDAFAVAGGVVTSVGGAVIAYLVIRSLKFIRSKKTIFVSYTHADSEFVNQLIEELSDLNVRFLVDRIELHVGDDIKTAVDSMIDAADSIIFVVSMASSDSKWSKNELEQAMSRKKKILPVVLNADAIPIALSGLYYADFSTERAVGFAQLRKTLGRK